MHLIDKNYIAEYAREESSISTMNFGVDVSSNPPREKGIVKGETFLWETVLLKNSSQNEQELTKVIQM